MGWHSVSPNTMGWIPLKGLVMAKRQATPRTCVIWGGMWLLAMWNKIEITNGIHSLNFLGENNPKGVQKPSKKDHLLTNGACFRMSIWRNQKKVWGLGLIRSLRGKVGSSHLIQNVVWWDLRWCHRTWV